ncbi:MAG TPA: alginate export family protein [Bacteroidales bacterium]|nr:alginate export family protein [Bacteroidales bacterium]
MKKYIFILALICFSPQVISQTILSGELRPKTEFRDGYRAPLGKDQLPVFLTSQRSRLNLLYKDSKISTRLSVQDVRLWGEAAPKADMSTINLYEAWAELSVNPLLSLKMGRQELSYDQGRILGAPNWNDVGITHDLFLLKYHKDFDLHIGFAYNNDKSKNSESNYPVKFYKTLAFARAEKNIGKYLNTSGIFLFDGNQPAGSDTRINSRYTYGINILVRNDSTNTRIYAQGYLQSGKSPDGVKISAYMFSLSADHAFTGLLNGVLGIDYLSGDDPNSADGKLNSFSTVYGNGHTYYGSMDYFSSPQEDTRNGGLVDIYAKCLYKLSKRVSVDVTYHNLSLVNSIDDDITSPGEILASGKRLGSEIDFQAKYKALDNLEINCGYSTMAPTSTVDLIKGVDNSGYQQWIWMTLSFKPEFLNTAKSK